MIDDDNNRPGWKEREERWQGLGLRDDDEDDEDDTFEEMGSFFTGFFKRFGLMFAGISGLMFAGIFLLNIFLLLGALGIVLWSVWFILSLVGMAPPAPWPF